MESIQKYISANTDRFLNELFELIRIPSISAESDRGPTLQKAAEWLAQHLKLCGADLAQVMPSKGWPVVYAEKIIDKNLPTVLVYGHYDVQPAEPYSEWISPAFEPEIRDGKIFARGADDDKGQLFMQIKAFEYMCSEKCLPCNVKFIIEGEEEIGSPSLKSFCTDNKKLLKSDVLLLSDTTLYSLEIPTITVGLRGLAYFEIGVKGPVRDLHSGIYGGAVNNPVNMLAQLIAGMKDKDGKILIPGFYDSIKPPSAEEKNLLNQLPFNDEIFAKNIGVEALPGEKGYSVIERIGIRPSLDVNGIWGGYSGEGSKTILPSTARAKISMRLVPGQDPENIEKLLRSYLKENTPAGVTVELVVMHGGLPYVSPWESTEVQSAVMAMEKTFGKKPLPVRSGGSIPVIANFEEILGVKAVMLGFGLDSDAIHSPNENFPVVNFLKGIETLPWFYHFYVQNKQK